MGTNVIDKLLGETIGGCRLDEIIGQGGMGIVYKGHHLALDIPVAVKIMLPHIGREDGAARFLKEAQAAARLKHPNIIGVYNVGEDKGWHFITMEYIEGKSLQQILDETKKVAEKNAVGIGLAVLAALEEAFENGIVHRDLKPDNILIDKKGVVKLGDLGIAKGVAGTKELTRTGLAMGSPSYMAPEQAQDAKSADHRADIYSLGCIMFHMLAGSPPFEGKNQLDIALKHLCDEVPLIARKNRSVQPGLSEVIRKMMDKDPRKRYQTPLQAGAALKRFFPQRDLDTQTAGWFGRNLHVPLARSVQWNRQMRIASGAAAAVVAAYLMLSAIVGIFPFTRGPARRGSTQAPREAAQETARSGDEAASEAQASAEEQGTMILTVMDAVQQRDTAALRGLLNRNISPNYTDNAGKTPLHEAVQQASQLYVRLLLQKQAEPDQVDNNGDTPLHYAIRMDSFPIAGMLLDHGANPNLPDRDGRTPLQIATAMGNTKLVMKLREKGAQ
jgi:predicted Ser/Thr protein kinase